MTTEAQYSINFSRSYRKFCLSVYYNGANSYLLVDGTEIYRFKAKDPEINKNTFLMSRKCFGRFSS